MQYFSTPRIFLKVGPACNLKKHNSECKLFTVVNEKHASKESHNQIDCSDTLYDTMKYFVTVIYRQHLYSIPVFIKILQYFCTIISTFMTSLYFSRGPLEIQRRN